MNRFSRQPLSRVKQSRERLNQCKRWPLILTASIVWGIAIWQIYRTEFLAGFWGITNDEIAVVTIEKDSGDNEETSTETIIIQDPSKSFWDGLQLLGVPLVLVVLGAWFQKSQQEQAERAAKEQREQTERTTREQREQDADETREEVLQRYFDRISTLLIDKNLMAIASKGDYATAESKELLEASLDVIRARTLSILRRFEKDIDRKSSVIRFLAEAEIISKLKLDLNGANLVGAKLVGAKLQGAILQRAILQRAKLQGAKLEGANLEGAILEGAKLQRAKLQRAILYMAKLTSANLEGAILYMAKLTSANLEGAILTWANLQGANLRRANLEEAILEEAILEGAILTWANLEGAILKGAILKGAILEGAILKGANLKGADLDDTYFDNETVWPAKEEVAKANNVPIELQKQLGLIPTPPQKQSTAQQTPKPPQ